MALQTCVSPALRERAAAALTIRLVHSHGDFLPRPGRFKNKIPKDFASLTTVRADPIELLIVRAIAMTSTPGAVQFGVSPDGCPRSSALARIVQCGLFGSCPYAIGHHFRPSERPMPR